jgi:SNF2 family DNA or RNA helicase
VSTRTGTQQPDIALASKNDEPAPEPFKDLQDFYTRASTKTLVAIDLSVAHCTDAARGPRSFLPTGGLVPEEPQASTEAQHPERGRVVIYTEFPSLVGPVIQGLELHGLKVKSIVGKTSELERARTVNQFGTDKGADVLIISSAAMTGINLSAAHVMILLDQLFSWWDKHQIIGRINRGTQARQVIVYDLIAVGTGDVLINSIAMDKRDTLEEFVHTNPNGNGQSGFVYFFSVTIDLTCQKQRCFKH